MIVREQTDLALRPFAYPAVIAIMLHLLARYLAGTTKTAAGVEPKARLRPERVALTAAGRRRRSAGIAPIRISWTAIQAAAALIAKVANPLILSPKDESPRPGDAAP